MGSDWALKRLSKQVAVVLAVMALAVRVVAPSGFMLAPDPSDHGLPHLIICTGHGPLLAGPDQKPPADAPQKQDPGHVCVFAAANAPGPASVTPALIEPVYVRADSFPTIGVADQRPGLSLAAPPPPSQGPPQA